MQRKPRQVYEARAKVAKALAHPTRLLLLDVLNETEMCVGDLTELVGADQSTVSKHLAVLKEVGLVMGRKERAMNYYRVNCKCLEGFFGCIESVLRDNLKAQRAAVEA
ncbi:MAG: ArsR/SmtB family transcription factor [Planctomycetota bacterium]|jgi:ArsR family transcriptional regulator